MRLSQIKTIGLGCALGIGALLLVAIPIGFAQLPSTHPAAATPPRTNNAVAPAVSAPATDGKPMTHLYQLAGGTVLQRFPPPFPSQRLEFYRENASPGQVQAIPSGPDAMLFRAQLQRTAPWGMTFGSPYTLSDMLEYTLGISSQEIEGDRKLVAMKLPGDFLMAEKATDQQYMDALADIASKVSNNGPITISSRQVERPITVLRGTWSYHPAVEHNSTGTIIELYGRDLNANMLHGGGGSGNGKEFADWTSNYIKKPVVIEAQGVPRVISWHLNGEGDATPQSRRAATDAKLVLQHLQEQTGLTASEENRTVRRVFVEQEGL